VQLRAATQPRRALGSVRPHTWPAVALYLLAAAVAIWMLLSAIGLLLTHVFNAGPVHAADVGVNVWFSQHRTKTWDAIMLFGTDMAMTSTVIAVAAVVALLLRWRLRTWRASLILATAVIGEVLIFLAVSMTVPQRRPPVPRLQVAPPTSSYPSGHTAAAVALYGCIAVLLLTIYAGRPAARVAAALLFCIPAYVGISRIYEGEHYPSDVLAGALLGALWLICVLRTLPPRPMAVPAGIDRRRLARR
jgi:membrane-associated phospholipid phosphatase